MTTKPSAAAANHPSLPGNGAKTSAQRIGRFHLMGVGAKISMKSSLCARAGACHGVIPCRAGNFQVGRRLGCNDGGGLIF